MKTVQCFAILACILCLSAWNSRAANWYVATIGNDGAAGTNWATAKQNIQAAIDVAVSNDTVWVSNGVYATGGRAVYGAMTNRAVIDKPITVQSVNGPAATVIQGARHPITINGDAAVRCAYVGANAVLSGFTLTNGATRRSGDFPREQAGGGAWCEASGVISNCTLIGNSAFNFGGGAYQGTLNNCTLTGNSAFHGGGSYRGTLNNCTLYSNGAGSGGGGSSGGTLNNCTLSGNSAGDSGGGADGCTLNNCIVYYNNAVSRPNHADSTFNYSCTIPAPGGTGNVTSEPGLASATHLAAGSPCIGQGSSAYTSGTDIDGEAWLNPPSMGCDEVVVGSITGVLSVGAWVADTNVAVGFPVQFRADITGPATASSWQWGDGATTSNQPYAAHAFATGGTYVVVLTTYNESHPLGVAATVTVQVAMQMVHYVNISNATPVSPFSSWATAATNIQDAIDVASQSGALLLVSNGVYSTGGRKVYESTTNRVVINKPLTVQSVNGPDVTIIQGAWHPGTTNGNSAVRCVYVGTNAVLSGFMLTNGATRTDAKGGGAFCESSGVISNCMLFNNSAYYGGGSFGGILNNCTLSGNSASKGGGVYYGTLNNCILSGNSANKGGNESYYGGGGSYYGTLNNCTLSGNSAPDGGGSDGGTLNNCTLSGNSASRGGGSFSSTLNNCALTGNSAYLGGGSAAGMLNNCTLSGNLARDSGGGSSGSTLNNCMLSSNSAGDSGGGSFGGTLNNCTLTWNTASTNGGGSSGGTLNNCIVYYNTAIMGPNHADSTFNFSCTTPAPGGTGNITSEPGLASATHLAAGSPCIGQGSSAYMSGTDIDGETWCIPPSMGCDEVMVGSITGVLSVGAWVAYTNVAVGFPVQFSAVITGHATASSWQWGDGTVTSNQPYAAHAFATGGTYVVVLTAYNESHPLGVAATVTVQVSMQTVHYVSISNATPVSPFSSWATAATNIQDAIDAASQTGSLVLVSNGVYATGGWVVYGAMTNRVVINKPLTVQSVNGPSVTAIKGAGPKGNNAVRCAYVGMNATLSGFMLMDGATRTSGDYFREWAGGGAWCEASGVVSNCMLSGNSAYLGGGSFGGTLNNCTISGNSSHDGGGSFRGTLNNCIFIGNMASDSGGGSSGSTLNNCTLSGNIADWGGGGSSGGTLNNCILSGNSSSTLLGGGSQFGILYNCLLTSNSAYLGGGGSYEGTLNNCTLIGNSAGSYGGGGSYGGTLNNCIVYYNTAPSGPNHTNSTIFYTCTTPVADGSGNITNDPHFANAAAGDYRLGTNSSCIDKGRNAYIQSTTDLEGNPRIVNGSVDMGAYECQSVPLVGYLAWASSITNGLTNATDCATGDGFPNLLKYATGSSPTNSDQLARLDCANSNGVPVLIFNRNTNAGDATLIVQVAFAITNGALWTGFATNLNGAWIGASNVTESGVGNPVTCRVLDASPLRTNRFLRLKVTCP